MLKNECNYAPKNANLKNYAVKKNSIELFFKFMNKF